MAKSTCTHPCPYTFPHKSRAAMVDYICGIGGYYGDHTRWPIEFNVAADRCNFDIDHILKKIKEDHGEVPEDPVELALWEQAIRTVHKKHEHHMWEWGQEDAYNSLHDSDTYKMLWDGDKPLDVEFQLRGRSGKHLVLTRFEGMKLEGMTDDDLRAALMRQDVYSIPDGPTVEDEQRLRKGYAWEWPLDFVKLLYRYVRQCEVDFTPQKASDEVEYQAIFNLYFNLAQPEFERLKELVADREQVAEAARTVWESIPTEDGEDAFRTLCLAAGVSPSAIGAA